MIFNVLSTQTFLCFYENFPYPLSSGNIHRKYFHEDLEVVVQSGQNRHTNRREYHMSSTLCAKFCNKMLLGKTPTS